MLKREFDYVIVGAGATGCVLAARLTEDPTVSVALLEAGGMDSHPLIGIPGANVVTGTKPSLNWGYRANQCRVSAVVRSIGRRVVSWAAPVPSTA